MVGAIGFEPTTPCSRSKCATRLRYAPTSIVPPLLSDQFDEHTISQLGPVNVCPLLRSFPQDLVLRLPDRHHQASILTELLNETDPPCTGEFHVSAAP